MRVFPDITVALKEINRDLSKAPKVTSYRVQQLVQEQTTAELVNYTYAVDGNSIPEDPPYYLQQCIISNELPWVEENFSTLEKWLAWEVGARLWPESSPMEVSTSYHPELVHLMEGEHWSYTYPERMLGWKAKVVYTLKEYKTTRRAYWPIYWPVDAHRMNEPTRIPCTLGYLFQIREIGDTSRLEITILQRSCDYDKFMVTDLFLASAIQKEVYRALKKHPSPIEDLELGNVNHQINSLHRFMEEGREIF